MHDLNYDAIRDYVEAELPRQQQRWRRILLLSNLLIIAVLVMLAIAIAGFSSANYGLHAVTEVAFVGIMLIFGLSILQFGLLLRNVTSEAKIRSRLISKAVEQQLGQGALPPKAKRDEVYRLTDDGELELLAGDERTALERGQT